MSGAARRPAILFSFFARWANSRRCDRSTMTPPPSRPKMRLRGRAVRRCGCAILFLNPPWRESVGGRGTSGQPPPVAAPGANWGESFAGGRIRSGPGPSGCFPGFRPRGAAGSDRNHSPEGYSGLGGFPRGIGISGFREVPSRKVFPRRLPPGISPPATSVPETSPPGDFPPRPPCVARVSQVACIRGRILSPRGGGFEIEVPP